mmetsp:Transcript_33185/g.93006  ORF Transcript_33185/g.93006 Transcript_33185/m.93006 type:complete len:520 (-) Transcript_33185:72-1631(-)|eukprot:CAMPEP_0119137482 /NCGR_PEP_ID=MMETSP1310-20130426/23679_1 /TAXON_ID=464262 /ORGANISM="Genus nov. species nov., Strain RCC2339" /LENGTH=519 /DNA_ID=CAMNT_0007128573 /DNA_START=119 /DNA_END=1678 /DNA_ORIENTATION=-
MADGKKLGKGKFGGTKGGNRLGLLAAPEPARGRRSCTVSTTTPSTLPHWKHKKMAEKGKSVAFGEDRPVKEVPPPEWVPLLKSAFWVNGKPDCLKLREQLYKEGRIQIEAAKDIITMCRDLLKKEPNLLNLEAELNVVGDIHGQFYDMLNILNLVGCPTVSEENKYLFLGDYVDRGMFSVEVCLYLFALKINYPDRIWMLRGNHESRLLTSHFNFEIECCKKYNKEVYELFMDCFDYLPLAATVVNDLGKILCMHGGLSPSIKLLEEIDQIDRVMEPPAEGPMCDLLWSDPMDEATAEYLEDDALEAWYAIEYTDNPTRGCGWVFGGQAVDDFLMENDLLTIVRGHEVQTMGYYFHYFMREDTEHPMLITIFSAPNYCDMYGNDAAVLRVTKDAYEVIQAEQVDHPYYLPDLCDAFNYTLPFVFEELNDLCYQVLRLATEGPEPGSEVSEKLQHLGHMIKITHQLRESTEEKVLGEAKEIEAFEQIKDRKERWSKAKNKDEANERNPTAPRKRGRGRTM